MVSGTHPHSHTEGLSGAVVVVQGVQWQSRQVLGLDVQFQPACHFLWGSPHPTQKAKTATADTKV